MSLHRLLVLAATGLALGVSAPGPGGAQAPRAAAADAPLVYRVPVTGVVEMGLAPFVERSLRAAEAAGAQAVVLDIDTPGGRVDAAQRIVNVLRDSPLPVYAYVNPRALSAGALIALAADGILMRPGGSIGAATPVTGTGETAPEKIVSAMRAEMRALAEERGLDPRVAEAMVDPTVEVPGLDTGEKLLTLSTADAVRIGYAREARDWDAVLAGVGAAGARTVQTEVNWAERLVRFFTHPVVAPLLLSLGMLGLMVELRTPAFGLAGLTGVTSLGLFFGSHLLLGLAGWEVVLLLAAGVILLLVELLVLPGFGVAGVLGIAALLASVGLSLWGSMPTAGDLLLALNILAGSLVVLGLVAWQMLKRLPGDRRAGRMVLQARTARAVGYTAAALRTDLLGARGVALTDLRPAGTAHIGDEHLDVVSDGGWIAAGTPVRVVRTEGYRQVVEAVP